MEKKDYQFTAVPTNLFMLLDNNCRSMLFAMIQLSTYYADQDGWFFRTYADLECESNLSHNLVKATIQTLFDHDIIYARPTGFGKGRKPNYYKVNYSKFEEFEKISIEDAMKNPDLKIVTVDYKGSNFKLNLVKPTTGTIDIELDLDKDKVLDKKITLVNEVVNNTVINTVTNTVKSDNNIDNIDNLDNIKNIYNINNIENNNNNTNNNIKEKENNIIINNIIKEKEELGPIEIELEKEIVLDKEKEKEPLEKEVKEVRTVKDLTDYFNLKLKQTLPTVRTEEELQELFYSYFDELYTDWSHIQNFQGVKYVIKHAVKRKLEKLLFQGTELEGTDGGLVYTPFTSSLTA